MVEFRSLRTGKVLTELGARRKITQELPASELWEAGLIEDGVRLVFKAHPHLGQLKTGKVLVKYANKKNSKEVFEALRDYMNFVERDIYI